METVEQVAVDRDDVRQKWFQWHCKLGHLNEDSLKKLTLRSTGLELEVPEQSSFEYCRVCNKLPIVNVEKYITKKRANRPLEIMHLNVTRLYPAFPTEVKPFIIVVVDDYTNFCKINFCTDGFQILMRLEDILEISSRVFHTKVGTMLLEGWPVGFFKPVVKWLKNKKIRVSTCFKRTRSANPKAARLLRLFIRTAKALVFDSPKRNFFFTKSMKAATYLFNVSTVIDDKTPHERWFKKRPDLTVIRPFGSIVYDGDERVPFLKHYVYIGFEYGFYIVWDPSCKETRRIKRLLPEDETYA